MSARSDRRRLTWLGDQSLADRMRSVAVMLPVCGQTILWRSGAPGDCQTSPRCVRRYLPGLRDSVLQNTNFTRGMHALCRGLGCDGKGLPRSKGQGQVPATEWSGIASLQLPLLSNSA